MMSISKSYVICAIQRSGSYLLCEALKNTGLAGRPHEYFLALEDSPWAQLVGITDRRDYLKLVCRQGTTPNGVFGAKLMWNYLPRVFEQLRELSEYRSFDGHELLSRLFPGLHYIWLQRQDRVRQAVSWALAAQTEQYAAWHAKLRPLKHEPVFDFEQIDAFHNMILAGEEGWQHFFRQHGITPLEITYEELARDYEPTALRVLDFLGVPYPADLEFSRERHMLPQATSRNDEWAKRYRTLKQQQNKLVA